MPSAGQRAPSRRKGLLYIPCILVLGLAATVQPASSPAAASEPAPRRNGDLPRLDQTGVVVPWEDFRKILEEIRRGDPVDPPPPPPVDYALSGCDVRAEVARDQEQVRVSLQFSAQVLQPKRWVEIPVIAEGVALSSFSIDGRPANVYRKDGHHRVALKGEGRHLLSLEYLAPVVEGRGTRSASLTFPGAPVITLDLVVPRPGIDVNIGGAVIRSIERGTDRTRVRAALQHTSGSSVTWFRQVELGEKETKVFGEVRTLLSVGEGALRGTSSAVYTVHGRGVDAFRLSLPADLRVLDVSAEGIRDWSVAEPNGDPGADRDLLVRLNYRAQGAYAFQISFEKDLAEGKDTRVPDVVLREVIRDKGFIAIAADTNVEVEPAGDLANAAPVDPAELPPDLVSRAGQPILYGFKYLRHPVDVSLKITRHEDLSVKRTIVESARMFTYLSPEGKLITSARYTVKNNRKQYLELTLPADAEGWGAYLVDRPVKAARDEAGRVLIPLKKTSAAMNGDPAPFDVELVYFQRLPVRGWGRHRLSGPVLDVDALEVQWHLFLPRDRRYWGFDGNLHLDEELNRILYVGRAAYNLESREDRGRLRAQRVGGKTIISDGRESVDLDAVRVQRADGFLERDDKAIAESLRSLGYVGDEAAGAGPAEGKRERAKVAQRLDAELKEIASKGAYRPEPGVDRAAPAAPPSSQAQAWSYAGDAGALVGGAGRARGVLPVRFGIPTEGLRLSFTGRILTAAEAPSLSIGYRPAGWTLTGPAVFALSFLLTLALLWLRAGFGGLPPPASPRSRLVLAALAGLGLIALFAFATAGRVPFWLGMAAGVALVFAASLTRRVAMPLVILALLVSSGVVAPSSARASTPPPAKSAQRPAAVNGSRLPDLPGTEITISWEDFKKLVERTYVPPIVDPPPPSQAFLRSAEYTGRLEPGVLTLEGTLVLEVLDVGWVRVPLGTQGTVIRFEGGGALLHRNGNGLEVLARGPRTYTLRSTTAFTASRHPGENRLAIALPDAPRNLLDLAVDPSFRDVAVEAGLHYRTRAGRLYVALAGGSFAMKYRLPYQRTEDEAGREVKLEPRVQLEAYQLLGLGEGVVSGLLVHDYTIRVAKVDHFDVDLPPDIVVFDASAPGLESWKIRQREGGERYLRVKLRAPTEGKVRVSVRFEGTYGAGEGRVIVPRFAPREVERESGFVAIAADGAEVELGLSGRLLPADVSELPADVTRGDPTLVTAFKYSGAPDQATVAVSEHEDAAVLTAIIESLNATAAFLENGTEATWVDLTIKNNRKQFLNFRVPGEDVEIWSLLLNGEPAKPKRTGDDILVPLPRGQGEVASRISLVLLRKSGEVRSFGTIEPYLPTFDVPVSEALWTVYLPPGRRYVAKSERFRPVVETAPLVGRGGTGGLGLLGAKVRSAANAVEESARYADAASEPTASAQKEQEARVADQLKRQSSARRGALPVRIPIPGGLGQLPHITMSRMLIVGEEDNTFAIRVYPAWIGGALRLVQRLLLLASAALLGLRLAGVGGRRFARAGLAAGVAGLIPFGGVGPVAAILIVGFVAASTWGGVLLARRLRRAGALPA